MYFYLSILFLILIIILLYYNPDENKKIQKGGADNSILPLFNFLEINTLDYNNLIFGEILNFPLDKEHYVNINIHYDIDSSNTIKNEFYIDFINYNTKNIDNDIDINSNKYYFRIKPNAFNINKTKTIYNYTCSLNNINILSKDNNQSYINNLNTIKNKDSINFYVKITPINIPNYIDENYMPLKIQNLNFKISLSNIKSVVQLNQKKHLQLQTIKKNKNSKLLNNSCNIINLKPAHLDAPVPYKFNPLGFVIIFLSPLFITLFDQYKYNTDKGLYIEDVNNQNIMVDSTESDSESGAESGFGSGAESGLGIGAGSSAGNGAGSGAGSGLGKDHLNGPGSSFGRDHLLDHKRKPERGPGIGPGFGHKKITVGLKQCGNTCFMNACIQLIIDIEPYYNYFSNIDNFNKINEYKKLDNTTTKKIKDQNIILKDININNDAYYNKEHINIFYTIFSEIKKNINNYDEQTLNFNDVKHKGKPLINYFEEFIKKKDTKYKFGKQNDASEFMIIFIQFLMDYIGIDEILNIINDIFYIQKNTKKCINNTDEKTQDKVYNISDINNIMYKYEYLYFIDLENNDSKDNIQDLLSKNIKKEEILGVGILHCNKKKLKTLSTEQYKMFGKYIIIVLKRFLDEPNSDGSFNAIKIKKKIEIQKKLTINNHNYNLKGCIIHSGPSLEGGHYYYYKFINENDELLCNDSEIKEKKYSDIKNDIDKNGYIFLYKTDDKITYENEDKEIISKPRNDNDLLFGFNIDDKQIEIKDNKLFTNNDMYIQFELLNDKKKEEIIKRIYKKTYNDKYNFKNIKDFYTTWGNHIYNTFITNRNFLINKILYNFDFDFDKRKGKINFEDIIKHNNTNLTGQYSNKQITFTQYSIIEIENDGWCFYNAILTGIKNTSITSRQFALLINYIAKNDFFTDQDYITKYLKETYNTRNYNNISGYNFETEQNTNISYSDFLNLITTLNNSELKNPSVYPVIDEIIGPIASIIIGKNICILNNYIINQLFFYNTDVNAIDQNNTIFLQFVSNNHFNLINNIG